MAVEYKGRGIGILGHLILMSVMGEVWFWCKSGVRASEGMMVCGGTEDRHGWVRLAVAVCTTERSAVRSGRVKPKHN